MVLLARFFFLSSKLVMISNRTRWCCLLWYWSSCLPWKFPCRSWQRHRHNACFLSAQEPPGQSFQTSVPSHKLLTFLLMWYSLRWQRYEEIVKPPNKKHLFLMPLISFPHAPYLLSSCALSPFLMPLGSFLPPFSINFVLILGKVLVVIRKRCTFA